MNNTLHLNLRERERKMLATSVLRESTIYMSHRTPFLNTAFFSAFSLIFLGGCVHETWTYRAVSGVNVTRPYEPGSQGPLVLVSMPESGAAAEVSRPDPMRMIDQMKPEQIGMFDRGMSDRLTRRDAAVANLHKLQLQLGESHPKIMEAKLEVDEDNQAIESFARDFREVQRKKATLVGGNLAPAPVEVHKPQTVLVASVQRDWGKYETSVGRTIVLFIDGDPAPGEYWLNADNSVLIGFSAYSAPARTRVGLTGSIKVLSVKDGKVEADIAIHETTEADSTNWVEKPYDPINWQVPWTITGRHAFQMTTQDDPALKKAALQWMRSEDMKK